MFEETSASSVGPDVTGLYWLVCVLYKMTIIDCRPVLGVLMVRQYRFKCVCVCEVVGVPPLQGVQHLAGELILLIITSAKICCMLLFVYTLPYMCHVVGVSVTSNDILSMRQLLYM